MKAHVKKNDMVIILSGDDPLKRQKARKVLAVYPRKGLVVVEGVRMIKKAVRKSQDRPQGGFVEKEAPIHLSNVMLAEVYEGRKDTTKSKTT